MEITVENFNYSNIKECISDFSHADKVRFAVYCAELVIDIYEKYNSSKAPRQAIEAAKKWIESPTEENKKACKSYAADAAYASAAASAAGESIKENIVNWLNEFNSKNIETPEGKEAFESISGKITIDIERYNELCGFEREIKIRDLMKESGFGRDVCEYFADKI